MNGFRMMEQNTKVLGMAIEGYEKFHTNAQHISAVLLEGCSACCLLLSTA